MKLLIPLVFSVYISFWIGNVQAMNDARFFSPISPIANLQSDDLVQAAITEWYEMFFPMIGWHE